MTRIQLNRLAIGAALFVVALAAASPWLANQPWHLYGQAAWSLAKAAVPFVVVIVVCVAVTRRFWRP